MSQQPPQRRIRRASIPPPTYSPEYDTDEDVEEDGGYESTYSPYRTSAGPSVMISLGVALVWVATIGVLVSVFANGLPSTLQEQTVTQLGILVILAAIGGLIIPGGFYMLRDRNS